MAFKLWTIWHFLYILSPILIIIGLYFLLRKRSEKTRYIVGVVIGSLSLAALLMRNITVMIRGGGLTPQAIPLQICHFGNIVVFISLVFRSKIATSIAWTLNLFAAFSAMIFADGLAGYESFWMVYAQAYFWGHLLICVGALYAIVLRIVRIDLKSFLISFGVLACLVVPSIFLNPYFNYVNPTSTVNYFYIFNAQGTPFKFLYNSNLTHYYGDWFSINYVYTLCILIGLGAIMVGFYFLQKLFYLKDKNFETHNIFYKN